MRHRLKIDQVVFDHGIGRQRLDGIGLQPEAGTEPFQLYEPDRITRDIDTQKGTGFLAKESKHYRFPTIDSCTNNAQRRKMLIMPSGILISPALALNPFFYLEIQKP
ncbi:hypothetical protein D3C76_1081770 [compost metagenome]